MPQTAACRERQVEIRVIDDLPRPVPVSRAEIEVLERYLGPALDALLRAMKP